MLNRYKQSICAFFIFLRKVQGMVTITQMLSSLLTNRHSQTAAAALQPALHLSWVHTCSVFLVGLKERNIDGDSDTDGREQFFFLSLSLSQGLFSMTFFVQLAHSSLKHFCLRGWLQPPVILSLRAGLSFDLARDKLLQCSEQLDERSTHDCHVT